MLNEDHAPAHAEDTMSLKEIKVRIPVAFHLKLHAFKVLKGKPISDTIVEALDAYFKAAETRKSPAAQDPVVQALPLTPRTWQDPSDPPV